MLPLELQKQLLSLAELLPMIVVNAGTPEALIQVILNLVQELKTTLAEDGLRSVQAAEVKAVIRAVAYRLDD